MSYSLEQKMSKDKLIEFCKRNYIKKLSLFGSALRGSLHPDSDIDLLVEFEEGHTPGLFSIVKMEMELADALGTWQESRFADTRRFEQVLSR
jgi:predicted nucleotidyltransferase